MCCACAVITSPNVTLMSNCANLNTSYTSRNPPSNIPRRGRPCKLLSVTVATFYMVCYAIMASKAWNVIQFPVSSPSLQTSSFVIRLASGEYWHGRPLSRYSSSHLLTVNKCSQGAQGRVSITQTLITYKCPQKLSNLEFHQKQSTHAGDAAYPYSASGLASPIVSKVISFIEISLYSCSS